MSGDKINTLYNYLENFTITAEISNKTAVVDNPLPYYEGGSMEYFVSDIFAATNNFKNPNLPVLIWSGSELITDNIFTYSESFRGTFNDNYLDVYYFKNGYQFITAINTILLHHRQQFDFTINDVIQLYENVDKVKEVELTYFPVDDIQSYYDTCKKFYTGFRKNKENILRKEAKTDTERYKLYNEKVFLESLQSEERIYFPSVVNTPTPYKGDHRIADLYETINPAFKLSTVYNSNILDVNWKRIFNRRFGSNCKCLP